MRQLYLVRHGQVDFPDNIRRCIGWTDLPLSLKGRKQAMELGAYFRSAAGDGVVFASPLIRARETAGLLAGEGRIVCVDEGLKELYMGEWENVPMGQIKKTLTSWPGTGERREDGLARFRSALRRILADTRKDVICVAHAGLNSCFLSELLGTPLDTCRGLPQPYGCFSRIQVDENGHMEVKQLGIMPKNAPDDDECADIWDHYRTPEKVRRHCEAVCRQAMETAGKLLAAGRTVDWQVIRSGALLHDVARREKDHAAKGAQVLLREGYPAVAEVIRRHHDLDCRKAAEALKTPLWLETAVVYLADKQVMEDRIVSLDERFAESRKRCREAGDREAALAAHKRRYEQAMYIETIIKYATDGGKRP